MTARARAAIVPFVYFVAASFTLASFLAHWGPKMGAELDSTLSLSQARPYALRVLSPLAVRAITTMIPHRAEPALLDLWGHGVPGFLAGRSGWVGPPSIDRLACTWLMLASLWGTALVWRSLVRWALPGEPLVADAAPAVAVLALPATFTRGGFLYDFPELLLVSGCYLAFVRRRWAIWFALLPLAVLNREASVLCVVWWLAVRGAMARRTWWTHATASAALGAGVVAALWWCFRDRPGAPAQLNLAANVAYWASFRWLFEWQDAFGMGVPLPVGFHAINVALLFVVVSYGRRRIDPTVARALAWSAGVVAPLLLCFGFEDEIRVFAVAFPPLVVVGAGAVQTIYAAARRENQA